MRSDDYNKYLAAIKAANDISDYDLSVKMLRQIYAQMVAQYCQEQGITIGQYEKQCFWADRDWGNYPEPERHNPDRCIALEREEPTHSRMEHER